MSDFSKRHYDTIAKAIKAEVDELESLKGEINRQCYDATYYTLSALETRLSEQFEDDNPNFKRNIFREACGL